VTDGLARMDEAYRDILSATLEIENSLTAILGQLMALQRTTIDNIRDLEILVLGGLLFIILATTLHGSKLVRDLDRSERQRAQQIDQLRRHDRDLQQKIHDLSVARGALARGEQRFRDGIESMADGFILYDGEDRIVAWNSAYESMRPPHLPVPRVGLAFRDYCEEVARALFTDDERIRSWVEWRVSQRRTERTRVELPRADGRFIEVTEHRTAEGGIVGLYRDVSEQRRAKQQLLATQARLQDFAAVASDWY
jgi:PAS domain-containing protein